MENENKELDVSLEEESSKDNINQEPLDENLDTKDESNEDSKDEETKEEESNKDESTEESKEEESKEEENPQEDQKEEQSETKELTKEEKKAKRKARCKKTKKVLNIVGYCLVGIIFIFTFVALMYKFTGSDFYLFGKRYDVVLTDSMSVKNELHADFLEGTTQYQPMDLVLSDKIENETVLNVKDVVLFDNPKIGTDMHRIVDIRDDAGDTVTISTCKKINKNNLDLLSLYDIGSNIKTNVIYFSKLVLTVYSVTPYDHYFQYYFSDGIDNEAIETTAISSSWYKTVITLTKTENRGGGFTLAYAKVIDFENTCFIESIEMDSKYGAMTINSETMDFNNSGTNTLEKTFNQRYKYLIRGDKQALDDGWFSKDQLYSRVTGSVSKIGVFIRFITSSWGLLCFLGLAIIFLVYDMVINSAKTEDRIVLEEQSSNAIANKESSSPSEEIEKEIILQEEIQDPNKEEGPNEEENIEDKEEIKSEPEIEAVPDVHEVEEDSKEPQEPEIVPLDKEPLVEEESKTDEQNTDSIKSEESKVDEPKKAKRTRQPKASKGETTEDKPAPKKKKYLNNKSKKAQK